MKKNSRRSYRFVKGEKFIYAIIFFLLVAVPISNVFTKALLSESNIEVEQLKNKISKQENLNESLSMQIDELASLDKIQELANQMGLNYNYDNVKVISENR